MVVNETGAMVDDVIRLIQNKGYVGLVVHVVTKIIVISAIHQLKSPAKMEAGVQTRTQLAFLVTQKTDCAGWIPAWDSGQHYNKR